MSGKKPCCGATTKDTMVKYLKKKEDYSSLIAFTIDKSFGSFFSIENQDFPS